MADYVTSLIPPPSEELTPADANIWLREHFRVLTAATFGGFKSHDPEAREACFELATDVLTIAEACLDAQSHSQSVKVRFDDNPLDARDKRLSVALAIGALKLLLEDYGEPFIQGVEELTELLVIGLKRDAERASAARQVA